MKIPTFKIPRVKTSGWAAIIGISACLISTFFAQPYVAEQCVKTGCNPASIIEVNGHHGRLQAGDANTMSWTYLFYIAFAMQWGGGVIGLLALFVRITDR